MPSMENCQDRKYLRENSDPSLILLLRTWPSQDWKFIGPLSRINYKANYHWLLGGSRDIQGRALAEKIHPCQSVHERKTHLTSQ